MVDTNECIICLNNTLFDKEWYIGARLPKYFEFDRNLVMLKQIFNCKCQNFIHNKCAKTLLKIDNKCPTCRIQKNLCVICYHNLNDDEYCIKFLTLSCIQLKYIFHCNCEQYAHSKCIKNSCPLCKKCVVDTTVLNLYLKVKIICAWIIVLLYFPMLISFEKKYTKIAYISSASIIICCALFLFIELLAKIIKCIFN